MNPQLYAAGAAVFLLVLLGRRAFLKNFLKKYAMLIDGILFAGCFSLLAIFFYQKKEKAGVVAVSLGAIAIGKYLYDQSRDEEETRN